MRRLPSSGSTSCNAMLAHPIEIDGLTHAVAASAGVALAPTHGDDVALLLQRADIAMYLAKERRSVVELYSVEHDTSMRRKLMLTGLLTQALEIEDATQRGVPARRRRPEPRDRPSGGAVTLVPPRVRPHPTRRIHCHCRADGDDQPDQRLRAVRSLRRSGGLAAGGIATQRGHQRLGPRVARWQAGRKGQGAAAGERPSRERHHARGDRDRGRWPIPFRRLASSRSWRRSAWPSPSTTTAQGIRR